MSPEEVGVRYFTQRIEFCAAEGIPLTLELLSTHVTGAILVAVSASLDDQRELIKSLSERIAIQSELLSRRAETSEKAPG